MRSGGTCCLPVCGYTTIQNPEWRRLLDLPRRVEPRRSQDLLQLARPHYRIDFWNVLPDLVPVALHQAPGHDQPPRPAARPVRSLMLRHFEDSIDRLLFGRIDKRAGIDDQDFGRLDVRGHLGARAVKKSHHHLAVDEVLRTAQRHKPDLWSQRGARRPDIEIWGIDGARSALVEKSFVHLSILPEGLAFWRTASRLNLNGRLRPLHFKRVDFLGADIPGKQGRVVVTCHTFRAT